MHLTVSASETYPHSRNLTYPLKTRFVRVVILETEATGNDKLAFGMTADFYGCKVANILLPAELSVCSYNPDTRVTNVEGNRHFVVDEHQDIAFVCDIEPTEDAVLCYASQPGGASPWRILPLHVHAVTGWDAATGRTYFQDEPEHSVVYSVDGGLTFSPDKYAQAASGSSFQTSILVPGVGRNDFVPEKLGNWEASFDGLSHSGHMALRWTRCCSA
ncbi:unnamed protein product [Darwinula stevensoni]|uniref:Uncharacterized protein n=1 Tax=Darwinula stevensoni TaxID=69355 RepID=A0A7R8XK79_9CRUS|nr:unnamed protein product [Darwinula stevensoni]CAG0894944.1 unnamed protein product [Darwinula stevensoni]